MTLLGTSTDGSTYLEGPCMFELKTFELGYYCGFSPDAKLPYVPGFPYSNQSITKLVTGDGKSATSYLADFISDLVVTRNAIFGFGFAIALTVAFVYSYLMTLGLVDCVVWSCILITFALFFGLGGYMYYTYQQWDAANCDPAEDDASDDDVCTGLNVAHSDTEISGMMYTAYVMFGISALWVREQHARQRTHRCGILSPANAAPTATTARRTPPPPTTANHPLPPLTRVLRLPSSAAFTRRSVSLAPSSRSPAPPSVTFRSSSSSRSCRSRASCSSSSRGCTTWLSCTRRAPSSARTTASAAVMMMTAAATA